MATYSPFIAANKFGLGLQPGELPGVEADPRGWLLAQIPLTNRQPPRYADMASSATLIEMASDDYRTRQMIQQDGQVSADEVRPLREIRNRNAQLFREQTNQRLAVAIESDTPFAERLVRFWSNHFSISLAINKPTILYAGLPYENEAIRANMNGRFEDMLISVATHPVMLTYLDNTTSIGPNSPAAQQRENLGLNENYARETLELHTLGVDGGYTQDDVIALARMLTGWTVNLPTRNGNLPNPRATTGAFVFYPALHEPGTQQLLGKSYFNSGVQQGISALRDLARHPSTAYFIASKLARHFIADQPPTSAIEKLARVFADTQGDLPSVHQALVELDEAWDPAMKKLKSAEDFVVSTTRALPGVPLSDEVLDILSETLASFNQRAFTAPSPAGWPEQAEHWGGPDALLKRVEFINMVAGAVGPDFDAREIVPLILPSDAALQTAIRRSESQTQALALLLASPQFQWRA
ncbi:DUF1800 domain-containing protein [Pseudohongiella spirulinae]|uniref:DUF1800 domain-containing protein n=1 Tax=Pseudohongiella spirulinae TaxID=1249552 RepID=A0A0S2KBK5_9GAMM|nr:DUF1800 domain-containing protein [Pseudohongiella spirulinae]ALO45314.1 hypothetical protein PS2015_631 [Pseudohongiella spirulinae]